MLLNQSPRTVAMPIDHWQPLSPQRVGLWFLTLEDVPDDAWPRWHAVLDNEERDRAGRFVHDRDRRPFIAAHALLRLLLQHFDGRSAGAWRFVGGVRGKPALHADHALTRLSFNISHTRAAVACALTLDHAVGVDVEDLERPARLLEIASAYFAPAEVDLLRAAPPEQQHKVFLTLWTLKEAYIKGHGDGLFLPLDKFAFSLAPLRIVFSDDLPDDPDCWQFWTPYSTETHVVSVAVRHGAGKHIGITPYRVTHSDIDRLLAAGASRPASSPVR